MPEYTSAILAFLFTILIFSYILGDNPFFRVAIHIFIGISSAYVLIFSIQNNLIPMLYVPLTRGSLEVRVLSLVPLILSIMLIPKVSLAVSKRFPQIGHVSLAFLIGVGTAIGLAGAIRGTLLPQVTSSITALRYQNLSDIISSIILILGIISSLAYFQYRVSGKNRSPFAIEILARLGQGFIAILMGLISAGVLMAAITALVDRVMLITNFFHSMPWLK